MSKALILTIGSRGDVQPYVALGRRLMRDGYEVRIATSSSFESFVTGHGIEFGALPNDLVELLGDDVGKQAIEDMQGPWGATKTAIKLTRMLKPVMRELMSESWKIAESSRPDVLVYNSKMPGAHIAESLDIPCALAIPFPQLVPTSEFPTLGFPELWRFNRLSYKVVSLFMGFYSGLVNEFRTEHLGLEPAPRFLGPYHKGDGSPVTVLHCYSPSVVPRPADWPDYAHVTGYWFLESSEEPEPELVDFVESGEAPVYVGFGSMSGRRTKQITESVLEAVERVGVRAILATGWGGLDPGQIPNSILVVKEAPHDWLFQRVSAVAHHGGAGTTAAGLRAGRPTVICPFFGDQPFWGKRVEALGVGSRPIPQKRLTADRLADAIELVTSDRHIRENARALGKRISAENGLDNASRIIAGLT